MQDPSIGADVLNVDSNEETLNICAQLRKIVGKDFRRRGVVVALSGGVDSSVCAALCAQAFGPDKVLALLLPERDSSRKSSELGRAVVEQLGVRSIEFDITPVLEAIGCYKSRDDAIRGLFPEYGEGWKNKIAISGGMEGGFHFFRLIVQRPGGGAMEKRLPHKEYLRIVAATNYKQRVRKTIEYFHADRLNYAVVGTPNRLEYDQGFFVKNGDGAADVKPIAHLYKTQVYQLAKHLGLPEEVCIAAPTTDTYSLSQAQDEFYFALPYGQMDLALWAHNHGVLAEELASLLEVDVDRAKLIYADIEAKRRTTRYLHQKPVLVEEVSEV